MTSTITTPSITSRLELLTTPSIDLKAPIHWALLVNQLKSVNRKLESFLNHQLTPQHAKLSAKFVYAIPACLIIKTLSSAHTATLSFLGGAYLWSCKEELISKQVKIDLLHSLAISFFASILNPSPAILSIPFDMTFLTAAILTANQIEKATEQTSLDAETVAENQEGGCLS